MNARSKVWLLIIAGIVLIAGIVVIYLNMSGKLNLFASENDSIAQANITLDQNTASLGSKSQSTGDSNTVPPNTGQPSNINITIKWTFPFIDPSNAKLRFKSGYIKAYLNGKAISFNGSPQYNMPSYTGSVVHTVTYQPGTYKYNFYTTYCTNTSSSFGSTCKNHLNTYSIVVPPSAPTPVNTTPAPTQTITKTISLKNGLNMITLPFTTIDDQSKKDISNLGTLYRVIGGEWLETTAGSISPLTGYLILLSSQKDITITGKPNTIPVVFQPTGTGNYMIGNPYTYDVSIQKTGFLKAIKNKEISDKISYYNSNGDIVTETLSSGFIFKAYQGYWIHVLKSGIQIEF